jgi:hypothetical protein
MFRSSSLRMCSMALRHPDKIFNTVLPLHHLGQQHLILCLWRTSSLLQWKESELDDKTLMRVLSTGVISYLQRTLRSVHKRKISWPVEESSSSKYVYLIITIWIDKMHYSSLTPSEYFMTLLRPIPDIFNQLHSSQFLKVPVKCIPIDFGHCESTLPRF